MYEVLRIDGASPIGVPVIGSIQVTRCGGRDARLRHDRALPTGVSGRIGYFCFLYIEQRFQLT
jgi:hypothetical protein